MRNSDEGGLPVAESAREGPIDLFIVQGYSGKPMGRDGAVWAYPMPDAARRAAWQGAEIRRVVDVERLGEAIERAEAAESRARGLEGERDESRRLLARVVAELERLAVLAEAEAEVDEEPEAHCYADGLRVAADEAARMVREAAGLSHGGGEPGA